MALDMVMKGEVGVILGRPLGEKQIGNLRIGKYRDLYTIPLFHKNHSLSDEGSYFVATNPTPGTPVAFVVNAAVSETAGYFFNVKNNDAIGVNAKRIFLDYIRLISGVVPASATSAHCFVKLDNINRYSSGGSTIYPVNPNMDSNIASIAQMNAGALTTVAPSPSARVVARGVLRASIPIVNDEWILNFGAVETASSMLIGGGVARFVVPLPPVIIGAQQTMGLQLWFPGNAVTPAQFEFELGWFER
jgi:hypothetical protein